MIAIKISLVIASDLVPLQNASLPIIPPSMQEDICSPEFNTKVYTEKAIRVGTFLGGPLVTGYLMAQNYKLMGQENMVRKTWLFTIMATFIIITLAFFLPVNMPNYLFPIAYSFAAYYAVKKLQGPEISLHIRKGGCTYSIWRSIWIGFIGCVISIAVLFFGYLAVDSLVTM